MVNTSRVFYEGSHYGAVELKESYQGFVTRALLISAMIHFAAVGSFYGISKLTNEEVRSPRIIDIRLTRPPSWIMTLPLPGPDIYSKVKKPAIGIPVPIPDLVADPDRTIMTQEDLRRDAQPIGDGEDGTLIGDASTIEDVPPLEFVRYEKEPFAVRKIDPKYPEIALRAGLEGNVFLKVWVDKEGKVRQAVILKSDAEIFNQAASEAALQWVFTPAIMQKAPVSVWVSIPFMFRLTGK